MAPARGGYRLKTGADEFFRYSAPKIVKYRVSESSKKIFCDEISAPFSPVNLESVAAQMSLLDELLSRGLFFDRYIMVRSKSKMPEQWLLIMLHHAKNSLFLNYLHYYFLPLPIVYY